jgi:hypothetical protein
MVTPELIEYIKGEVGKGRTREEIHQTLASQGGWNEDDLSEAFRTVIPMGNVITPAPTANTKIENTKKHWGNLVFVLVGIAIVFAWYFYRPQIIDAWNTLIGVWNKVSFNQEKETENTGEEKGIFVGPKNCGAGAILNPDGAYEENTELSCLGESAVRCEEAMGIIKNDLFPTVFEIVKTQSACNFRLSYPTDSTLVDINNQKLAGRYISCPLDLVKGLDTTIPDTVGFVIPTKSNFSEYASQIYFYGTLGLFAENDLDKGKIISFGCEGDYIDSVIESYKIGGVKK